MKLFTIIMMMACSAFAVHKEGHKHREHSAHKHGSAEMAIAFEGTKGEIELAAPSESIYGFEYVAKKEADKKTQQEALALLEKNISDMVQFDAALGCVIKKEEIEVEQHKGEKHSHVDAKFSVTCAKSIAGSAMTFNIQKTFPKLKDVKVTLVADEVQKSLDVKKDGEKLEVKK